MRHNYLKNVTTLCLSVEKCVGCGICAVVCPHKVFVIEEKKARIAEKDFCIECGACKLNCPTKAIEVNPGTGCAAAIIIGWVTGSEPSCDSNVFGGKNKVKCC